MKLKEYCDKITKYESNVLQKDEKVGQRIVCPEYSLDHVEVKTFPLKDKEDLFVICWNVQYDGKLYATIKPSQEPFSYHHTFETGRKTQYHTHNYIELAYVVEGEFRQRILGKDIQFQKGELCLIDRNCQHQDYLFGGDNTIVVFIGLGNDFFDEVMVDNIEEEKVHNFLRTALMKQKDIQQFLHFKPKNPEDNKITPMILTLLEELECKDGASKYICKGLLIRILHYISMEYEFKLSNEQRKKMNWLIFEEITNYIGNRYAGISIKELVDKFHFNEDYFNRLLKEKVGMTYSEYVQNLRLENAYKLLKTTDYNISTIIEMVGYQNKGYFYKIFLQRYGVTPARIRKHKERKD